MTDTGEKGTRKEGTPRWVKAFGIIALVLVLLVVVLLLTGRGGGHGPGRHTSGGDRSWGQIGPPPAVTHEQP
jgi:hypothetical protein